MPPRSLRPALWGLVCSGVLCLAVGAEARPNYPKELSKQYGPLLPAKLAACATCHAEAGDEPKLNAGIGKAHNLFGARLMALARELADAGKRADLPSRLDAAAREDSDGDGSPNQAELLLGFNPGRKADRPADADRKRLPALLTALFQRRAAYAWRPFDPVKAPPVPRLKRPDLQAWARNPVDHFVAAEWEKRGVRPRPAAPREVLLRRVYLDLIGLPPTREELTAFQADRSPDAYERVVDRLLASPRYGERWGRHWMDVWRYSDWDGYGEEVRNSQPHIWRWRDWIINSLNADKPYDRMVQEMLAGDELAPGDPAVLPATGFLVRNWYVFSRHETLTKVVEHTSKAFLGLTVACARCHDHKFDAVSQEEYFKFRAFFEPQEIRMDRVPGQPDLKKDGLPRIYDANVKAETFFLIQGDDRKPDKSRLIPPGVPSLLTGPALKIEPVPVPLTSHQPEKQPWLIQETVAAFDAAVTQARTALEAARKQPNADAITGAALSLEIAEARRVALVRVLEVEKFEDAGQKNSDAWRTAARAARDAQRRQARSEAQLATHILKLQVAKLSTPAANADAERKRVTDLAAAQGNLFKAHETEAAARAAVEAPPAENYTPRKITAYPAESSGRRLALARWVTDARNPLTARVAVNHIWLRHFGKALVPSVFDFGANGQPPTHPALLDYLAAGFAGVPGSNLPVPSSRFPVSRSTSSKVVEQQTGNREPETRPWGMKALHRLMVTSAAYRIDSTWDATAAAKDPDNRYYWRFPPRRAEAEVVRDSAIHLAGLLDPATGGPDLDPVQGETVYRRSVYFRHSVEKRVEFLATFDQANVAECYERDVSIVPQQALALANSRLALTASRTLAGKLWKELGGPSKALAEREFISAAFLQILGRAPTSAERLESERFLREQGALLADAAKLTPFEPGPSAAVPPSVDPAQRARESLVHVLFNHHEFITLR